MGRRKKKNGESMSPAAKPRTADRHAPGSRQQVAFPPGMYALLKHLAKRRGRPVNWEVARFMAAEHLRRAGMWPPSEELLRRLGLWPMPDDIREVLELVNGEDADTTLTD
jgi:hypothetical protein